MQHRLEEDPVHLGIDHSGGLDRVLAGGADRMEVEGDADRYISGQHAAQRLERETVAEQQVVGGGGGKHRVRLSRCVRPHPIPLMSRLQRLVKRYPHRDLVTEFLREELCVLGEALRRLTAGPAAAILERLRELPVIDGRDGRDPSIAQPVDQRAVVVEAAPIDLAPPGRLNPRPGDREAIRTHAELAQQCEILLGPVV